MHKSADDRTSPVPEQIYRAIFVTGIAGEFKVDRQKLSQICAEVKRIDSGAKKAENEVKDTTVFNALAESAGKTARPFRLGRNEIRQLIQDFAADPDYRDPKAQKVLVTEIGKAARSIATQAPEATDKLVSDLQLSRLDGAVDEFRHRLGQNQSETEWQKFFEADPFLLSFAFGYLACRRFRGHEDKIVTKELESGHDETEVQP